MKKSELKDLLRPIVKECVKESVKEMMIDGGLLSSVITEVVKGLSRTQLVERKAPLIQKTNFIIEEDEEEALSQQEILAMKKKAFLTQQEKNKINETKKRLVENIGKSAYSDINLFEGIKETIPDEIESTPGNPLANISPDDPGVSIDGILGIVGNRWNANLSGKKKEG